jgi:hypothetical protein
MNEVQKALPQFHPHSFPGGTNELPDDLAREARTAKISHKTARTRSLHSWLGALAPEEHDPISPNPKDLHFIDCLKPALTLRRNCQIWYDLSAIELTAAQLSHP